MGIQPRKPPQKRMEVTDGARVLSVLFKRARSFPADLERLQHHRFEPLEILEHGQLLLEVHDASSRRSRHLRR